MTSAYTQVVVNGGSFYDFAVQCAKAFIIDYRDNPKLPFPPPSKNTNIFDYQKELINAKDELINFTSLSVEDKQKMFDDYLTKEIDYYTQKIKECIELAGRYDGMLNTVESLNIPNDDYVAYKRFMINQLKESKDFDCNLEYLTKNLESIKQMSYDDWCSSKILHFAEDISYYETQVFEAENADNNKEEWIINLVKMLEKYKEV